MLRNLYLLFALITVFLNHVALVAAQVTAPVAQAPTQPPFTEVLMRMAPMFLVVFIVFQLFIIRPQKKKEEEQASLLKGLKIGDNVVTTSGMIARVSSVAEKFVTLEIASGVKVKFLASHITGKEDSK